MSVNPFPSGPADPAAAGTETDRIGALASGTIVATQPADAEVRRIITATPAAAGKGDFIFEIDNTTFLTTPDPILSIGYNLRADGSAGPVAGEPMFGWKIEADYNDGTGDNKIESYWQYGDNDGNAYRPIFLQINRDTDASLMEFVVNQLSVLIPNPADPSTNRQFAKFTDSTFTMVGQTAADSLLNIQGGTGRRGVLKLGYDGTDAAVELRPGASAEYASLLVGGQTITFAGTAGGVDAPGIGIGDVTPDAHLGIKVTNQNLNAIIIDAHATQAGALMTWRASDNSTVWSKVSKNGYFATKKNAAPADADITTNELWFWFDNTNAAGKAMFKGKTADGTVVSGSVALA